MRKRWRKERKRTMPSASVILRYLSKLHDKEQQKLPVEGRAFLPAANEHRGAFSAINRELIGFEAVGKTEETATLDMDATVSATAHEQLRVFKEALRCRPAGIKKVRLRSDTAGYQHDLPGYCDEEDNKHCGRREFAIGCDVTQEFRKAAAEVPETKWRPFYRGVDGEMQETRRQWAEVCFVPAAIGRSKKGPAYQYVATRQELKQPELPRLEKRDE